MKTRLPHCILPLFLLAGIVPRAAGQIPQMIAYQGRVAADGTNFHGAGQFKFALVNGAWTGAPGQTFAYWTHDGTGSTTDPNVVPAGSVAVACEKGLYAVLLGNAEAGMTPVPPSVFTAPDVRLRVWFNDGTHGFQKLTPDQRLVSTGYAMIAHSVPDGAITASKIADGAITGAKLAPGTVGFSQLTKPVQSGTVTVPLNWTVGTVDVTFPQPFAITPIVNAGFQAPGDGTSLSSLQVTATSQTGFSARVIISNATPQVFHYSTTSSIPGIGGLEYPTLSAETLDGVPVACYFDPAAASPKNLKLDDPTATFFTGPPGTAEFPWSTSLAMVNGARAFAVTLFNDNLQRRIIRFRRHLGGGSFSNVVALDDATISPLSPALLDVNGAPCIFFLDGVPNLRMIRANDAVGSSWGAPITVTTGVQDGFAPKDKVLSVKMVNGRAAVAFNSFTGLRYIRATDAAATVWGPSLLVDAGSAGTPGAVAMDDISGRPGIAWFSLSGGRLKFARASDADGTAWPAPVIITSGVTCNYVTLISVAGAPAIATRQSSSFPPTIRTARATDAGGLSWTPVVNISAIDDRIENPFMVLYNGQPAFFTPGGFLIMPPAGQSGTLTWIAQAP